MQKQSNELNFEGKNIFVGFDVHAKDWKVSIMVENIFHKTFIQPPRAEVLYKYLETNFPNGCYHSVYEAGFSGFHDHYKLQRLGVNSIVANPADVPTTGKEMIQKDDKRDSLKLVKGLRGGELQGIYIPSMETLNDRMLVRTRTTIVRDITRYKNRIKSFLYFHGVRYPEVFFNNKSHWSRRFMKWLREIEMPHASGKESLDILLDQVDHLRASLLQVNRSIRELSTTERYRENVELLKSIPGIGITFAMTLLVELEDVARFRNNVKFFSFIGIIPSTHSSGEKNLVGSITPRGHHVLRKLLVESAWIASRKDPALMKKHLENCKRMPSNKSIIHVARNLAARIRFVLVNKQAYKTGKL